jgi:hypothetical protein
MFNDEIEKKLLNLKTNIKNNWIQPELTHQTHESSHETKITS